jgi:general secretion pathway protein F
MPVFQFKALNDKGITSGGVVDADSPREARRKLKAQNLFVVDVTPLVTGEEKKTKPTFSFLLRSKNVQDLAMTTRQMATLLSSGIPLLQALTAILEQCEDRELKAVFMDIRERVSQGKGFSEALENHPRYFNELYVNMVRAGEASGNLDRIMLSISDYLLSQHRIRAKISAALTYPLVMLIVATGVIIFLMAFVVPKISEVIEQQGKALPLITEILMRTALLMREWGWLGLAGGVIAIILFKQFSRTPRGRLWVDTFILNFPVLGILFKKAATARFAITFATLLESGLPAVESLQVVRRVLNNERLGRVIDRARTRVTEGSDLATPLKEKGAFPPIVSYMVAVGEESGHLPELLRKISQTYNEEVEIEAQRLTSLLEPLMIMIMAGIVGFIALAMLLPILQMSQL